MQFPAELMPALSAVPCSFEAPGPLPSTCTWSGDVEVNWLKVDFFFVGASTGVVGKRSCPAGAVWRGWSVMRGGVGGGNGVVMVVFGLCSS